MIFIRFSLFRVRQGPETLALFKPAGLTQGNFDLFRFSFLSLGKDDLKNAILVARLNFLGINGGRKGQAPLKFPKETLGAEPLLAFFFFRLAFTGDGQCVPMKRDVDFFFFHAGHLGDNRELVFVLIDIDRRSPSAEGAKWSEARA